jgi:hypothetical protein
MSRPWLTATTARPSPRGYIHLPSRWWLRPNKLVVPDLTWDQIKSQRNHMYTCRNGAIWVANNWWLYRIHLSDVGSADIVLPRIDPGTGTWYYGSSPVVLEPVTRLQLRMETLWQPDR